MAATTTTFSAMLNDYLANPLLKEELIKRDWLLTNVEKDDGWVGASGASGNGGNLIVPFKAAGASSISFGALTAATDIAEDLFVRGTVTTQKELWGSLIFQHRDLMEHNKISEKNFLRVLPDSIDDFMDYMKNAASTALLTGSYFARLTVDGDSSGVATVDRPDRFVIGQKVFVDDDDSSPTAAAYVTAINNNTKQVALQTARTSGSATNLSAYTVAQNAKVYHPNAQADSFTSLRDQILSAANGGSSQIASQTKTSYPFLQAINVDGSDITSANIMQKIFDSLTTIRQIGKGNPKKVVMSYKNWGSCIKVIEASKGAFNVVPGTQKAEQYGWEELMVGSVAKGALTLVAVQEMDDDVIFFLDMRALTFYSNGFIRKRTSPDGSEFFEIRNTTGYQYVVDVCLFGDLVLKRPSYCGALFGISYT